MRAYIGVGSNLGDSLAEMAGAIEAFGRERLQVSSLYVSAPFGPVPQGPYLNAVLAVETGRTAGQLLRFLQQLEQRAGRRRTRRWGPRTLDLDLLLYDRLSLNSRDLILPHPGLEHRRFVLLPLLELVPNLALPHRPRLWTGLSRVADQDVVWSLGPGWWCRTTRGTP